MRKFFTLLAILAFTAVFATKGKTEFRNLTDTIRLVPVPKTANMPNGALLTGCTSGSQNAIATFTPNCSGAEYMGSAQPNTFAYVNVVANRNYTFRTDVSTDYITITNLAGTTILASGSDIVSWGSGTFSGGVRFYVHTNSTCGFVPVQRSFLAGCTAIGPFDCGVAVNSFVSNVTTSSVTFSFATLMPTPTSVEVLVMDLGGPGPNLQNADGSTTTNTVTVNGLTGNKYYDYWFRSNCGGSQTDWIFAGTFLTACPTPTNLTATNPTLTGIRLGWNNTDSSSKHDYLIRSVNTTPTDATTPTGTVGSGVSFANISGLLFAGTTYYYWVRSDCSLTSDTKSAWVSGGSFTTTALSGCPPPTQISIQNITSNSAAIYFTPSGADSYEVFYSADDVTPLPTSAPSETGTGNSVLMAVLDVYTYYHVWIRSKCGTTYGDWVDASVFVTLRQNTGVCNGAAYGLYPEATFTPGCSGSQEQISTGFAGMYSNVVIEPNTTYTFTSSNPEDYITLIAPDESNYIFQSSTPRTWNSGTYSGVFRYIIHNSFSCGYNQSFRNKYISCVNSASTCVKPSGLTDSDHSTSGVTLNWTASVSAPASYDYYFNDTQIPPGPATTPSGNVTGLSAAISGLTANHYYYYWVRSNCGTTKSDWARGGQFDTYATVCEPPSNFGVKWITTNSARITWSISPSTPSSYQIYYNTTGEAPTSSTAAMVTTSRDNIGTTINGAGAGLLPSTTYYFWMRATCTAIPSSAWIAGGSFTTIAATSTGCNAAIYGAYPTEYVIGICDGDEQRISDDARPGDFSEVYTSNNRRLTFASSYPGDYITVTDKTGTIVYASGVTPLVWDSSGLTGPVRFYLHGNASCGVTSSSQLRYKYLTCEPIPVPCSVPVLSAVTGITSSGATLNWTVSEMPANGFEYIYKTSNTAPIEGITAISGTSGSGIVSLTPLLAGVTYYYWVRSVCGITKTAWATGSFTTTAITSCRTGDLYPTETFSPSCSGSQETIATDAYAGEYTDVNIVANRRYTFASSVATDYITIAYSENSSFAAGTTPLIWNSGTYSGIIRFYIHRNSACGTQDTNRSRYITCAAITTCSAPTALQHSNVGPGTAQIAWTIAGGVPSTGYQVYTSTTNTAPLDSMATTPGLVTTTFSNVNGLLGNTTYYYWVRTICGTSKSAWVTGGSFTTSAASTTGCTTGELFPEEPFTPLCTGTAETITAAAWAGEYAVVNVASNSQYTFSSSVATDFITITNSDASVVYGSGTTPFAWNSGTNTGTIRYFLNTNSNCGVQETSRTRYITCLSTTGCATAAPTGSSTQSLCAGATVANLAATGTAVKWYNVATGGTALASTAALANGAVYYASQTISCESTTRLAVTVTITANPTVATTTPASSCQSGNLVLSATASNGATLNWYNAASGGVSLGTGTTFQTGNITTSTTFYVAATVGSCTSARTAVIATIYTMPTIVTTPGSRCGIGAVTLGATASAGTLNWYNSLSGGTALGTGNSFSTGALSETTTFYVAATNGNCTTERVAVLATVTPNPMITATAPASRCGSGSVTLGATANSGTLSWYETSAGGTPIGTGNTFNTPSLTIGRTYYVQATNGSCTSTRVAVLAMVNELPVITAADQSSCNPGSVTLTATATTGTIRWYAAPGAAGSILATGNQYTTGSLGQTTTFYAVATNGNCTSETAVTVNVTTVQSPAGNMNQTFCDGQTLHDLAVSGENISWWSVASGEGLAYDPFTPLVAGMTYYATQTVGSCQSASLAVTVSLGSCLGTEVFAMNGLKLYPNPITDILNISFTENIAKAEITNLLGQSVKSQYINSHEGKLDFSGLTAGVYMVKVFVGNHSETFKVIKK